MGIGTLGHTCTKDIADIGTAQGTYDFMLVQDVSDFTGFEIRADIATNALHNAAHVAITLQTTWDTQNDGTETWVNLQAMTVIEDDDALAEDFSVQRTASVQIGVKHRLRFVISDATPNGPYSGTVKVVYYT